MFWAIQQATLFPLLILSGMMLPLEAGPRWIQVVGAFNPLTYIVNAERALFAGSFTDPAIPLAVLAAVLTCAAGLWVGSGRCAGARADDGLRSEPITRRARFPMRSRGARVLGSESSNRKACDASCGA